MQRHGELTERIRRRVCGRGIAEHCVLFVCEVGLIKFFRHHLFAGQGGVREANGHVAQACPAPPFEC